MTAETGGGAGDWLARTWQDVTTAQPVPDRGVVLLVGVAVLVALCVPGLWHLLRHGLTIVHEAAHAGVAVLVGRRLSGIRVHSDTSGLTVSRGRPRGPGMVATVAAGYPGPAVLGLAAAWLLSRGYALGALWLLLVLVVLVLVQIRNWYGLWAVLVSGAVLVAVTLWAPPQVQSVVAAALTWFFLLGAPPGGPRDAGPAPSRPAARRSRRVRRGVARESHPCARGDLGGSVPTRVRIVPGGRCGTSSRGLAHILSRNFPRHSRANRCTRRGLVIDALQDGRPDLRE